MKLICPSCGTATSVNPVMVTKQGIIEGRSSKVETVRGEVTVTLFEPYSYGVTQYGILWCGDCGKHIVVEKEEYASEGDWSVVYPIPRKLASKEIPEPIKSEFEEAYLCFAVGAYRATASMCQRTLESICQNKKVAGLNELRDSGVISQSLFDRATEISLWAGLVKHKPIVESVSKEDAEQLLTYLEAILDHIYVQPARLDALKQKRKQVEDKPA